MRKKFVLLAALLLAFISVKAYDFKVGGLCYGILSEEEQTVYVDADTVRANLYRGGIVIPSSVKFEGKKYAVEGIGAGAFAGCYKVTSVKMPKTIKTIGDYAFYQCLGLSEITIPENVDKIGKAILQQCNMLRKLRYECRRVEDFGSFAVPNKLDKFVIDSLEIGKNVEALPKHFVHNAFNLKYITIPEKVGEIGTGAFMGCLSLRGFAVSPKNKHYRTVDGVLFRDNTLIAYPNRRARDYVMPQGTDSVGTAAFSNCVSLVNIVLAESLRSIGQNAFWYCKSLREVSLKSQVTEVGTMAFGGCSSLQKINVDRQNETFSSRDGVLFTKDGKKLLAFPAGFAGDYVMPEGVEEIENLAFAYNSRLRTINLAKSVEKIGNSSFRSCRRLEKISLSDNLKSIGNECFADCKMLEAADIPEKVESIGEWAFSECETLKSVSLVNKMQNINRYTFFGCSALENVIIGRNIKTISEGAFYACSALNQVNILASEPPVLSKGAFEGDDMDKCQFIVPTGLKTLFEGHTDWKDFLIEEQK